MDRLPETRRRRQLALSVVGLGVLALFGWSRLRTDRIQEVPHSKPVAEGSSQPPAPEELFVGSRACAECHRDIAEAYSRHPMANSLRLIEDPAAFLRQRPANEVPGDLWKYEVSATDRALVHSEVIAEPSGEEIYRLAVPMSYVVGSGQRAHAFLQQRGELLLMSPLNWYAGCQCWDLAPGYSRHDPRRFDRRVTDECLSCHAGRVAESGRGANLYSESPFHEAAIGCERCHGPGGDHIAAARSGDSALLTSTTVNPSKLERTRRDAVCYQCHLQTAARIPRQGRTDFSFRPGMDVTENWVFLDEAETGGRRAEAAGRFVSQVQQMESSRCFLESGGRLGCTSCHDPHRTPARSNAAAYYRDRCRNCHGNAQDCSAPLSARQEREDSCIACHVPKQEASNAVHVSQSDHRILRRPPIEGAADLKKPESPTLQFFRQMDRQLPVAEKQRALGLGVGKYLSKKGMQPSEGLLAALESSLREFPDDGEAWLALGSMAQQTARERLAETSYLRALALPGMEERALSGLLDIRVGQGKWNEVERLSSRSLEIDPGDYRALSLRTMALDKLGRAAEAREMAEHALKLHPSDQTLRRWLADASRQAGLESDARRHEGILHRITRVAAPDSPEK